MSIEQTRKLIRSLYDEVFNQGNLEIIDEVVARGFVDHDPTNPTKDAEGVKRWFRQIREAFPDLRVTIEDMITEGDKVVVRYHTRGTHRAAFMGVSPTGREVTGTGIDILRLRDEKIVEHWGEYDNLGLMQQLGVVPEQLRAPLAPQA